MSLPAPKSGQLAALEPKIAALRPATLVWRVYRSAGAHPCRWCDFRHFGPLASRFDHHLEGSGGAAFEQERGVVYAAPDLLTCIAEAFQTGRNVDLGADEPRLVAFHVVEVVRLLDLTGRFATQTGCHQGIHSSPLRRRTRAWARAFFDTWPAVQGLLYRSKMAVDLPAYVFFERAAHTLPRKPLVDLPLTDPRLAIPIASIARELGYSIG